MSRLRPAAAPLTALAAAVALLACGSNSSANGPSVETVAARSNPVAVSPLPGTPDAPPGTQISFLGASGTTVTAVSVHGSRSGTHSGTLRAYSTGTGESFVPSKPFASGETVTVHAQVNGPASGAVATSFTIASPYTPSQKMFPNNPGNASEVQHYASAPTLTPSSVRILTAAKPGAAPGYLFLAPYQGKGTPGPMIVDQSGNLVWFHPLAHDWDATNLQVVRYEGKPTLAWWQGRILEVGFGQGEYVLADSSYRQIARIRAGNGLRADLHEIRVMPDGTAWIDAFYPVYKNLTSVHGVANGVLNDSVVQQVDIKTGLVMWEWHSYGHIPFSESNNQVPARVYPWDFVHMNSVDPGSSGDVLVSSRNTWALYDLDVRSGAIRWRLGGKRSNFKQGPGAQFYWQHDAEWQPGGLISLFDNGSDPPKEKQSRGLLLAPDQASHTVTLKQAFTNPSRTLLAESQGNTLALPGGAWLMGYGRLPDFTEYDSAGHALLDGRLGHNVQDFRTYLSPWTGRPSSPPSLAVKRGAAGTLSLAASWNGATEVASWRVLAGASAGSLAPVASAPKKGFETTISAPSAGPYAQVQALDAAGNAIGSSAVVKA
ncbi:MAG TPA: arylsulfotransferase family protein [Solirubrobacteraceae bacterium]